MRSFDDIRQFSSLVYIKTISPKNISLSSDLKFSFCWIKKVILKWLLTVLFIVPYFFSFTFSNPDVLVFGPRVSLFHHRLPAGFMFVNCFGALTCAACSYYHYYFEYYYDIFCVLEVIDKDCTFVWILNRGVKFPRVFMNFL